MIITISFSKFHRLEIQAHVRQQGRNAGLSSQNIVETGRQQLSILFQELKKAMHIAEVVETNNTIDRGKDSLELWDDVAFEQVPGGAPENVEAITIHGANDDATAIEVQVIPLPSNGNIGTAFDHVEVTHRASHCDRHLSRLRELISEKSFQYSHVIRGSPRKGVNTRSRAEVKKLNVQISIHCRMYTQCRSRLIRLGADPIILFRFQELSKDDVKASSALVNPNEPGSTQLKLSWIWQTAGGHRWGLSNSGTGTGPSVLTNDPSINDPSIMECKIFPHPRELLSLLSVRRIHWLRARAQLMRWKEQVTLISYEMQWTVRYFSYMSHKWDPPIPAHMSTGTDLGSGSSISLGIFSNSGFGIDARSGTETGSLISPSIFSNTFEVSPRSGTGNNTFSPGGMAYRMRKRAVWEDLRKKADSIFRYINPAYESPL